MDKALYYGNMKKNNKEINRNFKKCLNKEQYYRNKNNKK